MAEICGAACSRNAVLKAAVNSGFFYYGVRGMVDGGLKPLRQCCHHL